MKKVGAIEKNRTAEAGNNRKYQYRGIDDAYAALQKILAETGVFTVPEVLAERSEERVNRNGTTLIYRVLTIKYYFYATDGSFFSASVIGEGMDSGDKASNKAMSVAHKYALLQVFCIPTEEPKDPETEHHELEPSHKQAAGASEASTKAETLHAKPSVKPSSAPPRTANPAKAGEVISEAQGKRLFAICNSKGWMQQELKEVLKLGYGIDSSRAIKRGDYEGICTMIETMRPAEAIQKFRGQFNQSVDSYPPNDMGDQPPPFTDSDIPF